MYVIYQCMFVVAVKFSLYLRCRSPFLCNYLLFHFGDYICYVLWVFLYLSIVSSADPLFLFKRKRKRGFYLLWKESCFVFVLLKFSVVFFFAVFSCYSLHLHVCLFLFYVLWQRPSFIFLEYCFHLIQYINPFIE